MNDVLEIHREAMRFVDQALRLRREGNPSGAKDQFRKALDCESRAAAMTAQGAASSDAPRSSWASPPPAEDPAAPDSRRSTP